MLIKPINKMNKKELLEYISRLRRYIYSTEKIVDDYYKKQNKKISKLTDIDYITNSIKVVSK
jgi:hypothetical protein